MRQSVVGAAVLSVCVTSLGHAAVNFTGSTISENFNGLIATGSGGLTSTIGKPIAIANTIFDGGKTGAANQVNLVAGNGSGTAGALYSLGSAAGDRALGSVATSLITPAFGVAVTNKATNSRITAITVAFTQETWRLDFGDSAAAGAANTTTASYGTSDTGVVATSYLNSAGFTSASALNLTSPGAAAGATSAQYLLDGNASENRTSRTLRIGNLDLVADEQFFLRFQDAEEAGNDAAMGIDDFSMSFETTPIVGNLAPAITFAGGSTMTVDVSPVGTGSIADTVISAADGDGAMSSFNVGALPAALLGKLALRPGSGANSMILSGSGFGYGDVGSYTIDFTAIDNGGAITSQSLTINVVPEPASLTCIAAAPLLRRRRR